MRIFGHMKRSESRMGCGFGSALGTGLGSERGSGLGCRLGFGPGSRLGSQLGSGIGSKACACPKYRCFCVWGGEASQKMLFLGRCAHKNTAVYIGACMPSYPKNLVFLGATAIDVVYPRCNMADFVYFRCTTCKYFAIHRPESPDLVPRLLYGVMSLDSLYPRQGSWQGAVPATTTHTCPTPKPHTTSPHPTTVDTPERVDT